MNDQNLGQPPNVRTPFRVPHLTTIGTLPIGLIRQSFALHEQIQTGLQTCPAHAGQRHGQASERLQRLRSVTTVQARQRVDQKPLEKFRYDRPVPGHVRGPKLIRCHIQRQSIIVVWVLIGGIGPSLSSLIPIEIAMHSIQEANQKLVGILLLVVNEVGNVSAHGHLQVAR